MADKPAEKPAVKTDGDGHVTEVPGVIDAPELGITPDVRTVRDGGGEGDPDAKGTHANGTEPDAPEGVQAASREDVEQRIRDGIPEVPRPAAGTRLMSTPGGFAVVADGVKPEQVGSNAVGRA